LLLVAVVEVALEQEEVVLADTELEICPVLLLAQRIQLQ
jgi:hypothetical protein